MCLLQFFNDEIQDDVKKNIIVNFIIQKLKSKHTSLKKYTNWAKLIYFSLVLREREEKTPQIFRTLAVAKRFSYWHGKTNKPFCLILDLFKFRKGIISQSTNGIQNCIHASDKTSHYRLLRHFFNFNGQGKQFGDSFCKFKLFYLTQ